MTEKGRFKIVNELGDYHLLNGDEKLGYDLCSPAMGKANWNNVVDKLNEYDSELQMCREKVVYWRNKANDTFGDMRTNVELEKQILELEKENKQMKFAFKRKYDYDIGEIVDEICDEDYTNGDVE